MSSRRDTPHRDSISKLAVDEPRTDWCLVGGFRDRCQKIIDDVLQGVDYLSGTDLFNNSRRPFRVMPVVHLIAGAIVLFAISEGISHFYLKRLQIAVVEEFPDVPDWLLEKFDSFDPDLGWVSQPNTEKIETVGDGAKQHDVTLTVDEKGSRVSPGQLNRNNSISVSTYGDSYCLCREVNNDETYQWYLSEQLGIPVSNYGVGNYGLDQALLRLKRQYKHDPTDFVVMTITSTTIIRILSIWKRYNEFYNILAVKPRYHLEEGDLRLTERPGETKEDLKSLSDHAEFLHEYDYHYSHWFKDHYASFPYTLDFLTEPSNIERAVRETLTKLEEETPLRFPFKTWLNDRYQLDYRRSVEKIQYSERLYTEQRDLFMALVDQYVAMSQEKSFTPILVMRHSWQVSKYQFENGLIYDSILDDLEEEHPELEVIDMQNHTDASDLDARYVEGGGHHSPQANSQLADILEEKLIESDN